MSYGKRILPFVLLLVTLAGCGGALGGHEPATTTHTPAPVPTDFAPVPPGVFDSYLSKPEVLLNRHESIVRMHSFTATRERVVHTASGEPVSVTNVTVMQGDGGQYLVFVEGTDVIGERRTYWSNGVVAFSAVEFQSDTAYTRAKTGHGSAPLVSDLLYFGSAPFRGGIAAQRGLNRYVLASEGSPVQVSRPTEGRDWFRYTIRTNTIADRSQFAAQEGYRSVDNVTLLITFDGRGFIRGYELRYTGQSAEDTLSVVETVSYSNLGTTSVAAPDWPIINEST